MFFRLLRDLARPQVVAIVDVLKRSDGMAVGDIAAALGMSYMGVKQYCIELEKRGYVDTWRRAKETGRPELTYRLTAKARGLFPQQSTELTMEVLEAVRQLHGQTAVEKILYQYFLKKTEAYAKKLKGDSPLARATALARVREAEGYCAQVDHDAEHGLRLTEFHNPLADVMKAYPSVTRMEESMIARLLQAPVKREQNTVSGLMRLTFLVAGATLPPQPPPAPPISGLQLGARAKRKRKAAAATETTLATDAASEIEAASAIEAASPIEMAPAAGEDAAASAATLSDEPVLAHDAAVAVDAASADGLASAVETASAPDPAIAAGITVPPETFLEDREPVAEASSQDSDAPAKSPPPDSDWLLFPAPDSPPPPSRIHGRSVTPARSSAKPAAPAAEELLLSL